MTLEPNNQPTQTEPTTTPEPTKQTKKKNTAPKLPRALEIAETVKDLTYSAAVSRIMEETPCSKAVAHKAFHKVVDKRNTARGISPKIEIAKEDDEQPKFIETPTNPDAEIGEIEPIEPTPPTIQVTDEQKEQITLIQDMLRSMYVQIASKEGFLGQHYGRSKTQCENLADIQFKWLMRRYSIDDLMKFDTIILVGAYATFIGGIAKDYIEERQKAKKAKA